VAVAEVFVGEANFFGSEEQSDRAGGKLFANLACPVFQTLERMMELAMSDGGGSHNKGAVSDGIGDGGEFLRVGQDFCRPYGGACGAKCDVIGVDDAQVGKAEIAHGAGCGSQVEGVVGRYQDDAEAVEFEESGHALGSQRVLILNEIDRIVATEGEQKLLLDKAPNYHIAFFPQLGVDLSCVRF
jgi:hypothetical protein